MKAARQRLQTLNPDLRHSAYKVYNEGIVEKVRSWSRDCDVSGLCGFEAHSAKLGEVLVFKGLLI